MGARSWAVGLDLSNVRSSSSTLAVVRSWPTRQALALRSWAWLDLGADKLRSSVVLAKASA